jgi:hypothetical protein
MFQHPNDRAITYSMRQLVDLAAAFEAKADARLVAGQRKNGQLNGPFGDLDADRRRHIILVMDVVMNLAEDFDPEEQKKGRDSE